MVLFITWPACLVWVGGHSPAVADLVHPDPADLGPAVGAYRQACGGLTPVDSARQPEPPPVGDGEVRWREVPAVLPRPDGRISHAQEIGDPGMCQDPGRDADNHAV